MSRTPVLVEVCAGSVADCIAAERGGANRIELNGGLQLGGLTPSAGLVRQAVQNTTLEVISMVRPRAGGFCYSATEWETALAEADWLAGEGVAGLAFGVLDEDSRIDVDRCREMKKRFGDLTLVFHRAFDLVDHWPVAVEQLIDCGISRVMTSGMADSALQGLNTIRKIAQLANNRIDVLPAAGINSSNAAQIVAATGAGSVHGSFSTAVPDPGYLAPGRIRFSPVDELRSADSDEIRKTVHALRAG